MAIAFDYAAVSDVGPVRANNEDSAYCSRTLLAVADGVAGAPAGELASALAVEALADLGRQPSWDGNDPQRALLRQVELAADRLDAAAGRDPALTGMSTTLTAVLAGRSRPRGGELGLVHVGDSRMYAVLGDRMFQLTRDHSFPQLLVEQGHITPAEAERHPQRSTIVRSLTAGSRVDADAVLLVVLEGQRLLLCSDGLSDYVPLERVSRLLMAGGPDTAAHALLEEALACGSRDNITVIVADVVPDGQLPPAELTLGAARERIEESSGDRSPQVRAHDPLGAP